MSRLDVLHDLAQHFGTQTGAPELLQHIQKGERVNFAHLKGKRTLRAADEQQRKAVNLVRSEHGEVRVE